MLRSDVQAVKPLPHQTRIPDKIYAQLYIIKNSYEQLLAPDQIIHVPSIQDIVNVALKRLINDWQDTEEQNILSEELLEQRKIARLSMGRRTVNGTSCRSVDVCNDHDEE